MKVTRIVLCYSNMDRIIVNKMADLERYDIRKVNSITTETEMSREEFEEFCKQNNLAGIAQR